MELRLSNVTTNENPVRILINFDCADYMRQRVTCRLCAVTIKYLPYGTSSRDANILGLNHLQVEHKLQIIEIGGREYE